MHPESRQAPAIQILAAQAWGAFESAWYGILGTQQRSAVALLSMLNALEDAFRCLAITAWLESAWMSRAGSTRRYPSTESS